MISEVDIADWDKASQQAYLQWCESYGIDYEPCQYAIDVAMPEHRCVGKCQYAAQRQWVGLNWDDLPEIYVGDTVFMHGAKWAEAKLKAKNT